MESHELNGGRVLASISNAIAALHRESYGRGPTKARTTIAGDTVSVVLEDIFTPAERTLIDAGNFAVVHQTRSAFQEAMRPRFIGIIEDHTRRRVRAFFSQTHAAPDAALEFFLLEPADADSAPRDGELTG